MKKFLLCALGIIVLTNIALSQQAFKTFLPKDGLPTAINQAKTQGLKDPMLIFLVTTSQKFEQMPEMFQPTVEMNSGKASMWMYQLKDKEIDTLTKMIIVTKVSVLGFDQYMPIVLPIDFGNDILPEFVKPLEGNWYQSDSTFASISRDNIYKEFAKNNPNHFVLFSGLGMNTEAELEPNTPYWFTLIAADTTQSSLESPMSCVTNALTNETLCVYFNSVSENSNKLDVFPNPSNGEFLIRLDKQSTYPLSISIINLNGIEVKNYTVNWTTGPIPLKINDIPAGEYLIWINNQEINALSKIIKH